MSQYFAKISWHKASNELFSDNQYSRGHEWAFDGGVTVPASASPHIVPLPYSIEANVDPEEAFVASISSCHMLFFLSIAAKKRFVINSYIDDATGVMERDNEGKQSMTLVTLKPNIDFIGNKTPSLEQINKMHHLAHKQCFIANSVKTKIVIDV